MSYENKDTKNPRSFLVSVSIAGKFFFDPAFPLAGRS